MVKKARTVLNVQWRRVFECLDWVLNFVFGWMRSGDKFRLGGLREKLLLQNFVNRTVGFLLTSTQQSGVQTHES